MFVYFLVHCGAEINWFVYVIRWLLVAAIVVDDEIRVCLILQVPIEKVWLRPAANKCHHNVLQRSAVDSITNSCQVRRFLTPDKMQRVRLKPLSVCVYDCTFRRRKRKFNIRCCCWCWDHNLFQCAEPKPRAPNQRNHSGRRLQWQPYVCLLHSSE